MNFELNACALAENCIDATAASALFLIVITCFAFGYGIGQGVLWVRRLGEVA